MLGKLQSFFSKTKKPIIIITSTLVVATITFLLIFTIFKSKDLSDTEQVALKSFNDKVLPYLEVLDPEEGIGTTTDKENKLIAFAMLYANGEEDKKELTNEEINEIIKTYFDTEIDFNNFDQIAISPYLIDNSISYRPDEKKYKLEVSEKTKKQLIQTRVTAYIQKEAKIKQNTITATYAKYITEKPYEVFTSAAIAGQDTTGCGNYFEGKGSVKAIQRLITPENADQVAEYKKDFVLTIQVKDGKLKANF